jgi:hypothetical protein
MDWRSIAAIAAGAAGFAAFVGVGAFAIVSLTPRDAVLGSNVGGAPQAHLTTQPVSLAVATLPSVTKPPTSWASLDRNPPLAPAPRATVPSPESTGALRVGSAEAAAPARPAQRGTDAILRSRLEQEPEKPAAEPEAPPARITPRAPATAAVREPASPPVAAPPPAPRAPIVAKPPEPRYEGVLTPTEIARMKSNLRMTPEQYQYWPPVEVILREIGQQQMALVRAGRKPDEAFGGGITGRLYWAARPLLGVLREDQKVEIRKRAHSMGFGSVASMI